MIYFDNSATTKVSQAAAAAAGVAMLEEYGNPSSLYAFAMRAEKIVQAARETIAGLLGVRAAEIYFTGCGTESNNWAFKGLAAAAKGAKRGHIIVSAIEHPSVLEAANDLAKTGYTKTIIKPGADGLVRAEDVLAAVREDTLLVSLMHVNNETGAIQPIAELGQALARLPHKVYFHVDAVQSFGKLPIHPAAMHIDLLSASGHKIHAPKGVGFLYIKKGTRIRPLLAGGGQERGMRSGTENVPGIAAFGAAVAEAVQNQAQRNAMMRQVRETLWQSLQDAEIACECNSPADAHGAAHILNLSFPGAPAEVLLHYLEQDGICVSAGSACSARKDAKSHVLAAMALSKERLDSALRFSFCGENTIAEARQTAAALQKALREIRALKMK